MINKTIKGDLIQLFKDGQFDVLIHGCNCFNTMGAGIAKQIKNEFPEAYKADCQTEAGSHMKLGFYSYCFIDDLNSYIINAYTQYNYGGEHPLSYPALYNVFSILNKDLEIQKRKIGIPMIGAGLAGGDWEHIKELINQATPLLDITVVEYDK